MTRETTPAPSTPETQPSLVFAGTPEPAARRNPAIWPNCSCGTVWRQSGNRTGHCSGCHRTFQGLAAFDRHRRNGACLDPTNLTDATGAPVYDVSIGAGEHDQGVHYWSMHVTDEQRATFAALNAERRVTL